MKIDNDDDDDDIVSSPVTTTEFRQRWDVFLSFRGEDTRHNFTGRLYKALNSENIRVFLDDAGLNQGDEISHGLTEAIVDSAAAIAVISPNYASSRWCLEELACILENRRRLLLPVFFQVDPSHVRRQEGPFKKDFEGLERRFGVEKVVRWREAMEKAGGIKGWPVYHNSEEDPYLIQGIVQRILTELSNSPMNVAPYVVGLHNQLEELMECFNLKYNGVMILGLHGMGGIGKTTLAKALYNKLSRHFEACSFISNVREAFFEHRGHFTLQNKLISDLSSGKIRPIIDNVNAGLLAIKEIVQRKRVFVVIDDIDHEEQLYALAGSRKWYLEGSRIIITTRDTAVLKKTDFVDQMYEVQRLRFSDSLKLFSYHAFRRENPIETFVGLCKKIAKATDGIPLALEVFGSFLYDKRRVEEWEDALEKLKRIRPHKLQDVLKISFDALDVEVQCVFLDISCLFLNLQMNREEVIDVLRGCGFAAETALADLVSRSLIKFIEWDQLWMHDQIRDMGRQIVEKEDLLDVHKRSRIWKRDDVLSVLHGRKGTGNTRGIILNFENTFDKIKSSKSIAWDQFRESPNLTSAITYLREMYKEYYQRRDAGNDGEVVKTTSLEAMANLRLLQLGNVKLEGNVQRLPSSLRWLQWKNCSLRNLPSDFCPRELAVLDLSESKIETIWRRKWSWNGIKVANQLMVLNLRHCYNITTTPDLSGHLKLEKLILERCCELQRIHQSIGDLTSLRHLNLSGCSSLVEFPENVSGLKSLEILDLSGCRKLAKIPTDIGSAKSLRILLLDETRIDKLPESIFRLTKLQNLGLDRTSELKHLPKGIGKLASLKELSLNGSAIEEIPESLGSLESLETLKLTWCRSLTAIPESVGNLKSLKKLLLDGSSLETFSESIGFLHCLRLLSLGNCSYLSRLPVSVKGLISVTEINLSYTRITGLPDEIGALKSVRKFQMIKCKSLASLPDSIGNMSALENLIITDAAIIELPEYIELLGNLIQLNINQCKKLQKLPSSIGKLKTLRRLQMEETAVTQLPETFGLLSNLLVLKMAKKPNQGNPRPSEEMGAKCIVLPDSFSSLSLLRDFDARAWKISGKIPDDFGKLSMLETLNLSHNDFSSLPASLRGLSCLKKLQLSNCKELRNLPALPSSLTELNASNCRALENVNNFMNLEHLEELNLANCEKLMDLPGIEGLKSLRRLHMCGCRSSAGAVKMKLDKAAVKRLYNLSIPGNEIPYWFIQDSVYFSKRKNNAIVGVVIAVIISISHEVPDDLRDQLPVIPDIQAKILRMKKPVFSSAMYLAGVPKTDEDQLYLCQYEPYHPLVTILKDGDEIQVTTHNPPILKGVHLKKYGINLVFENDDDYGGNEDSLDENQQSASEKLRRFIVSTDDDDGNGDCVTAREEEEDEEDEKHKIFSFFHKMFRIFCCSFAYGDLPDQK